MRTFLLLLLVCSGLSGFSQNYSTDLISDSLKKNANVVKRAEELRVIIKSPSKAVVKHKYALTILNESGSKEAAYTNYYNKRRSIESISGHLYDAAGRELKSVKKKDIGDYSGTDDISLITDNRVKTHNFYYSQYPYTVEYEDECEYDGIFFLPSWKPVEGIKYSVEQSSFIAETPADFNLRFKQTMYPGAPQQVIAGDKKTYTWQVKNMVATVSESYQPEWDEINPSVYIAPSQFEFDDYKGDMSSWKNLGLFIKTLNSNRQALPENVKKDIHGLTDNVKDTREKIKLVYDYLQKNTRYISIQLGIGSWQPFDATYVASKKYGDCKALSNYMVSLLKEVNIPANYVLITAGTNEKGLSEDFPSPYFNHAIMCVPQQKDTIWLECTSQTVSPGYMGNFTGNRKALLIDEDGGHVVTTPSYKAADNLQLRKINAVINEEGTLNANIITHFTGIQQEPVHGLMYEATEEQRKKYLNNSLSLPTYSVDKFEYKETKSNIPAIDEWLSVTSPNYAGITGKRLFITPNFFNRSGNRLSADPQRKYDIQFNAAFIDVDTIQIKLPEGYTVEALPKPVSLKTTYGSYNITFTIKDNVIDVLRKNERNEGRYRKNEYDAIVHYFDEIYKADRSRIVLVKKES